MHLLLFFRPLSCLSFFFYFFFFNDTATTEIYTLSLHDALPISTTRSLRSNQRCSCPSTVLICVNPSSSCPTCSFASTTSAALPTFSPAQSVRSPPCSTNHNLSFPAAAEPRGVCGDSLSAMSTFDASNGRRSTSARATSFKSSSPSEPSGRPRRRRLSSTAPYVASTRRRICSSSSSASSPSSEARQKPSSSAKADGRCSTR